MWCTFLWCRMEGLYCILIFTKVCRILWQLWRVFEDLPCAGKGSHISCTHFSVPGCCWLAVNSLYSMEVWRVWWHFIVTCNSVEITQSATSCWALFQQPYWAATQMTKVAEATNKVKSSLPSQSDNLCMPHDLNYDPHICCISSCHSSLEWI